MVYDHGEAGHRSRPRRLPGLALWCLPALLVALAAAVFAAPAAAYWENVKGFGPPEEAWGSATTDSLTGPSYLATKPNGNLVLAEAPRNRIKELTPDAEVVRIWGWGVQDGSAEFQICETNCQAGLSGTGDGQLARPSGIAVDSTGRVLVYEEINNRLSVFNANGQFVETRGYGVQDGEDEYQICESGCQEGISGSGEGQFGGGDALAVDSEDNLYFADQTNNRVTVFDSDGEFVRSFGSMGTAEGQFIALSGVDIAPDDTVVTSDLGGNRVQRFTTEGEFIDMFGYGVTDGAPEFQVCTESCQLGDGGNQPGQMNFPGAVKTDADGNMYVANFLGFGVNKYTPDPAFETRIPTPPLSIPADVTFGTDGVMSETMVSTGGAEDMHGQQYAPRAPETEITAGPEGEIDATSATFEFAAQTPNAVNSPIVEPTFECSLDGAQFEPCSSPATVDNLAPGAHTFAVRAGDPEGTDETPATREFSVKAPPSDAALSLEQVKAKKNKVKAGKKAKIKVRVANTGEAAATGVDVCVVRTKQVRKKTKGKAPCKRLGEIAPGGTKGATLKLKTKRKAKGKLGVRIRATADNAPNASGKTQVRIQKKKKKKKRR